MLTTICLSCQRQRGTTERPPRCAYCGCRLLAAPAPAGPPGFSRLHNRPGPVSDGLPILLFTMTAARPWECVAEAAPFADLERLCKDTRACAWPLAFGAAARAIVTPTTFRWLGANKNQRDIYGRRMQGGNPNDRRFDYAHLLQADDLPWPHGDFCNEYGLRDGVVVVIGERPVAAAGDRPGAATRLTLAPVDLDVGFFGGHPVAVLYC